MRQKSVLWERNCEKERQKDNERVSMRKKYKQRMKMLGKVWKRKKDKWFLRKGDKWKKELEKIRWERERERERERKDKESSFEQKKPKER